ncbi:hypothetical protein ACIRBY_31935 [Streptomyces sp. NPDC096136]|uniref:hypothetical protein n=1 Tax=Streptomyces sp. NPDC096136 TaxID=3366076 RepID=UPI0038065D15
MSEESVGILGREKRLARWEAMLSGYPAGPGRRHAEAILPPGVFLHAASRAEQGLEPTDLERAALGPLLEVLGDEDHVRRTEHPRERQAAEGH